MHLTTGTLIRRAGRGEDDQDQIGYLGDNTQAIFGRSYAAEPDVLIEQLKGDEAIAEATPRLQRA